VRCQGSDAFSGLASGTVSTRTEELGHGRALVRFTAKATHVAGNTTTRRGSYGISRVRRLPTEPRARTLLQERRSRAQVLLRRVT